MNFTESWAKSLEESEYLAPNTCIGRLIDNSRVEKLPEPFKMMACNPGFSALGILVVWILISIITFPLWLMSFIVTAWGSIIILIGFAVWSARLFARSMAFPGATKTMQRSMATDFMYRTCGQIEQIAHSKCANFTASVILVASGRAPPSTLNKQALDEVKGIIEYFTQVGEFINSAAKEALTANNDNRVTPDDIESAVELSKGLARTCGALHALHELVSSSLGKSKSKSKI
tara:strand:+ start:152 stop:847 length:696 start_codon:yes stop_codon:yes gene_type:complete